MELFEKIKHIRQKFLLSQAEFAESLGITPSHVSQLEAGKSGISRTLIQNLMNVYNVNPAWILEDRSPPFLPPMRRAGFRSRRPITDADLIDLAGSDIMKIGAWSREQRQAIQEMLHHLLVNPEDVDGILLAYTVLKQRRKL